MTFDFDPDKNATLFQTRGVTFVQVIESIAENGALLNIQHLRQEKYPQQWMFVVPYAIDDDRYFLKTIFPNRKYIYLLSEKEDHNEP